MTIRGCAYAGSKGVVWGPIKDMIHISHGPVGCGQYSRAGRRNYYIGTTGVNTFVTMNFTSDFQEKDIVFGGDKKLAKLIDEIEALFPLNKGISVQSECPIGLIGDDIEAVSKKKSKDIGKPVVPVRCEGFRGVSQSLGHHIANDSIRDHVFDGRHREQAEPSGSRRPTTCRSSATTTSAATPGRRAPCSKRWASACRPVVGRRHPRRAGEHAQGQAQPAALLPLDELHLPAHGGEVRHSLARVQLLRPDQDRRVAASDRRHFDDTIKEGAERVIEQYRSEYEAVIAKYRPRLEGKRVMLFVGGLRPRHVIGAYEDLGMEVVGTGYEFGHNDDYDRTLKEMGNATLLYDDVTGYEFEEFVKRIKPDLIGSGIKEKYIFQKMGIPFRQMHSWDYSGPYHGYDGFAIFARDMDMTLNNPCWDQIRPPWKKN